MGLSLGRQRPTISPPWSDLPPEFAGLVLCRLSSHVDRLSFRAVCSVWRVAARQAHPVPPAPPWLVSILISGAYIHGLPGGEVVHYRTHASSTCIIGCVDSWLNCIRIASNKAITRVLINPYSGVSLVLHPLRFGNCVKPYDRFDQIVWSPDLNIVAVTFNFGCVAFYRPGASSWLIHAPDHYRSYDNIAFHHGKLYAVTLNDRLFSHDPGNDNDDHAAAGVPSRPEPHPELVIDSQAISEYLSKRYLVSCGNKLLMVKMTAPSHLITDSSGKVSDRIVLKVFEADLVTRRWLELKNLEDGQALFVGSRCSKAIFLSGNDRRFQGNRVYFPGVDAANCCHEKNITNIPSYGFYDLSNGKSDQVFLKRRAWNRKGVEHINSDWFFHSDWFFPSM